MYCFSVFPLLEFYLVIHLSLIPLLTPPYLSLSCIHIDSICLSPLVFRSSLGEYHKDSRNLKRIKDSSEFTIRGGQLLDIN